MADPSAIPAANALGVPVLSQQQMSGLFGQAMSSPNLGAEVDEIGQIKSLDAQKQKDLAPKYAAVAKAADDAQVGIEQAAKGVEPIGDRLKPWTQQPPQEDPVANFGSIGAVFATLASAFTHQPMVNAMNAQASALNAIKANDLKAYDDSFKAWQENTKLALDRHQAQTEDFNTAMAMFKSKPELAQAALKAYSAKYDDAIGAHLTEMGAYDKLAERQQSLDNSARQLLGMYPDLLEKGTQAGLIMKGQQIAQMPPGPEKQAAAAQYQQDLDAYHTATTIGTAQKFSPPQEVSVKGPDGKLTTTLAQQDTANGTWVTADGRQPINGTVTAKATSGSGAPASVALRKYLDENPDANSDQINQFVQRSRATRSPATAAIQKYLQDNPNASAEDIEKENARIGSMATAAKAFATGKQGQAVNSFNVGIAHLTTMQDLADALGNGNIQLFNKLGNELATETGNPAPTNFDTAKAIVGDEIIKAIIGGGGALADRENAQNQISAAKSPQQLAGVIKTYKDLMAGQLNGLKLQYKQTTGLDDFEDRLTPETRKQLEGLGEKTAHKVGDIITGPNGKRYKITGGDMNDPDVELVP